MAKRKTTTSYEVHRRWDAANLKTYAVRLRIGADDHLINYIEERKKVVNTSQIIKEALELQLKSLEGK